MTGNDTASARKPSLRILLAAPRGFCAGVVRAIDAVEKALGKYGAPVYVRHEIVHNKYVVDDLKAKGAIFVEELDDIPDTTAPVIFSAHGVAKSVPQEAQRRNFFAIDATCPLVTKVHREAELHHRRGRTVVLIGHRGHPEVVGTMGQLPAGATLLVETVADVEALQVPDPDNLAWATQTTLSVDDTADIVAALTRRFPHIVPPHRDDICYATTNRQEAVKAAAKHADVCIVIGAPNSSNSQRLRETAERAGCDRSVLVQRASEIDWTILDGARTVLVTAGASAPEILVDEVLAALGERFATHVETAKTVDEEMFFPLPRELR
ncbi:MAG: 4-hydroxy-3-methylbut-2-enyl diphosphate reductase [Beijerinckiaceae bacterium]